MVTQVYLTREWMEEHPDGVAKIREHLQGIAKELGVEEVSEEVDFMTQTLTMTILMKRKAAPLIYKES